MYNVIFTDQKDPATRNATYRRVMTSLPLVARNTARKLFAHLHFLHSMAHANKMSAENLASVWAPTVMPAALVRTLEIYVILVPRSAPRERLTYIVCTVEASCYLAIASLA